MHTKEGEEIFGKVDSRVPYGYVDQVTVAKWKLQQEKTQERIPKALAPQGRHNVQRRIA